MANLVFICLIEQDVTWVDINGKNRIPDRNSRWKGGERLWEVNESAASQNQSTFEGPANIAEPGVDEGNIAAVDDTVEDDTCITGGHDPDVTVGGKLIAKFLC